MAGSAGPSGDGESLAEINVTPMVDVLLSLLIIFMVASPGPPNEQMPLGIPQDTVVQQANDPNAALLVTIDAAGGARLGKTPLAADYPAMVSQFEASEKAQKDSKVMINADEKVPYRRVIQIMAAAHESGVREVGIASDRL